MSGRRGRPRLVWTKEVQEVLYLDTCMYCMYCMYKYNTYAYVQQRGTPLVRAAFGIGLRTKIPPSLARFAKSDARHGGRGHLVLDQDQGYPSVARDHKLHGEKTRKVARYLGAWAKLRAVGERP